MHLREHIMSLAAALFGETLWGFAGAALQWIALAIVIFLVSTGREPPSIAHLSFSVLGVTALIAGLYFAIRGKSLGPVIVLPAVVGILILIVLQVVLYPVRWLSPDESTTADCRRKRD